VVDSAKEVFGVRPLFRVLLHHRGYIKLSDSGVRASEEQREQIKREFQLALIQHPDAILRAENQADLVAAALDLFREATEKVNADQALAREYAALGPTDEEEAVAANPAAYVPSSARDL
jgi:hypothetical protein